MNEDLEGFIKSPKLREAFKKNLLPQSSEEWWKEQSPEYRLISLLEWIETVGELAIESIDIDDRESSVNYVQMARDFANEAKGIVEGLAFPLESKNNL